jgi:uncharacterized protein (TIGR02266 family)
MQTTQLETIDLSSDPRRAHERAPMRIDVTVEGDHNFFNGFSENISEGGLFVATHSLKETGSAISLEFSLPGRAEPVRCRGEVRWVRIYSESSDSPPGMGVKFLDLTDEDAAFIHDFVTRRAPIFWD